MFLFLGYVQLLSKGVHIGHNMITFEFLGAWFLFATRAGVALLNLYKTTLMLKYSFTTISSAVNLKGPVWFINMDPSTDIYFFWAALYCGEFYITSAWVNGLISNYSSIFNFLFYQEYFGLLSLKESKYAIIMKYWHLTRFTWPRALFVSSIFSSLYPLKEAISLKIPSIGIADSDSQSQGAGIPVPGNDDSSTCLIFYNTLFSSFISQNKFSNVTTWFFNIRRGPRSVEFFEWIKFSYFKSIIPTFFDLINYHPNLTDIFSKSLNIYFSSDYWKSTLIKKFLVLDPTVNSFDLKSTLNSFFEEKEILTFVQNSSLVKNLWRLKHFFRKKALKSHYINYKSLTNRKFPLNFFAKYIFKYSLKNWKWRDNSSVFFIYKNFFMNLAFKYFIFNFKNMRFFKKFLEKNFFLKFIKNIFDNSINNNDVSLDFLMNKNFNIDFELKANISKYEYLKNISLKSSFYKKKLYYRQIKLKKFKSFRRKSKFNLINRYDLKKYFFKYFKKEYIKNIIEKDDKYSSRINPFIDFFNILNTSRIVDYFPLNIISNYLIWYPPYKKDKFYNKKSNLYNKRSYFYKNKHYLHINKLINLFDRRVRSFYNEWGIYKKLRFNKLNPYHVDKFIYDINDYLKFWSFNHLDSVDLKISKHNKLKNNQNLKFQYYNKYRSFIHKNTNYNLNLNINKPSLSNPIYGNYSKFYIYGKSFSFIRNSSSYNLSLNTNRLSISNKLWNDSFFKNIMNLYKNLSINTLFEDLKYQKEYFANKYLFNKLIYIILKKYYPRKIENFFSENNEYKISIINPEYIDFRKFFYASNEDIYRFFRREIRFNLGKYAIAKKNLKVKNILEYHKLLRGLRPYRYVNLLRQYINIYENKSKKVKLSNFKFKKKKFFIHKNNQLDFNYYRNFWFKDIYLNTFYNALKKKYIFKSYSFGTHWKFFIHNMFFYSVGSYSLWSWQKNLYNYNFLNAFGFLSKFHVDRFYLDNFLFFYWSQDSDNVTNLFSIYLLHIVLL